MGRKTIRLRKNRPETHNATRLNNAWWRCVKSGQRNPPVTVCLHRPCQGSCKSTTGWLRADQLRPLVLTNSDVMKSPAESAGPSLMEFLAPEQGFSYFSELLIEVNLSFRVVPRPLTTAIIASAMPAAISPYSMAVAPDSLDKNLVKWRFKSASLMGGLFWRGTEKYDAKSKV